MSIFLLIKNTAIVGERLEDPSPSPGRAWNLSGASPCYRTDVSMTFPEIVIARGRTSPEAAAGPPRNYFSRVCR